METKQINEIVKTMEKSLSPEIEKAVEKKFIEAKWKITENEKTIEALSKEVEVLKEAKKSFTSKKEIADNYQNTICDVVREVSLKGLTFEQAKVKAFNEGTDWEGAEFVFDQFEKDVLNVVNEETLLKEVKLYTTPWDNLKLPKYTNGVITTFEAEGNWATASQGSTGFVRIDIKRAVSSVNITEEVLRDAMTWPDLYELIVRDIGESQSEFLVNQILNWDGTGENFMGILNHPLVGKVQLPTGSVSARDFLTDNDITDIVVRAKRKFKKNKKNLAFVMSEYICWVLMNITTTAGAYLYPELRRETPTLRGRKVILSDFAPMQDWTEDLPNSPFLIFGDMKYFALAKNQGLEIDTWYINDNFNNGIKTIRAKQRIGWELTFPEAFTVWVTAAS